MDGPFLTYCLRSRWAWWRPSSPGTTRRASLCWKLGPALASGLHGGAQALGAHAAHRAQAGRAGARRRAFPRACSTWCRATGNPTGEALARHPDVDKISFTGSSRTARRLLQASAATNLKKLTLELGRKEPADRLPGRGLRARRWRRASGASSATRARSATRASACSSTRRPMTRSSAELAERAQRMTVGDPLDPATEMGAQISAAAARDDPRLHRQRQGAGRAGCSPAASGTPRAPRRKGNFVKPTVFGDVQPEMKIAQEEIFGPVLSCLRFRDEARGAGDRQRHVLRPGGVDLDAGRGARRTRWRSKVKSRRGVDQLLQRVRRRGAVRRLQGVRLGPRPVPPRAGGLPAAQGGLDASCRRGPMSRRETVPCARRPR